MSYLDDCVELVTKGTTPTSIGSNFTDSGINFLKVESISESGNFIKDKIQFIDQDTHQNLLRRSQLQENDILFSIAGTIGRTAIATPEILPCNTNQALAIIRPNLSKVNPYFLLYCLKDKKRLNKAKSNVVQSVQSNLSLSEIKKIEIPKYSLQYQSKISEVLKKFDDKIELNQKMNETLDEIAETLFKSWFIDFDPVRAKAEGRPTGLSKEISDLFPDSFEDSELGEIPSGWKISNLGDKSFEIESGKRPKGGINKELKTGIPSVGAESVSSIGTFDYSKEKFVTHKFYETCLKGRVKNNDVAIYKDGGKPGLFMPRVALYGEGFPYKEFLVNEHVFLLRSTELGQFFLYHLINSSFMMHQIVEKGSAKAAQPGLNQEEVKSCKFISPSTNLIDEFNKTINPSIKKQLILGIESNTLANLRDTLLPKLISGELKIPDAENLVKEANI